MSLKIALILANSKDPDEMQHYAAFHLGLHCLPKYPFRGFKYTNGLLLLMSKIWVENSKPVSLRR